MRFFFDSDRFFKTFATALERVLPYETHSVMSHGTHHTNTLSQTHTENKEKHILTENIKTTGCKYTHVPQKQ